MKDLLRTATTITKKRICEKKADVSLETKFHCELLPNHKMKKVKITAAVSVGYCLI
jgi:hypothetical protein